MSPEEKIEAAQKLIDEARAEFAAKRRNWPEEIRLGMTFRRVRPEDGLAVIYVAANLEGHSPELLGVIGTCGIRTTGTLSWLQRCRYEFDYLGMDYDVFAIKIADDAHEPTGAELVGKVCIYTDDDGRMNDAGWACEVYEPGRGYSWGNRTTWYKHARLAR